MRGGESASPFVVSLSNQTNGRRVGGAAGPLANPNRHRLRYHQGRHPMSTNNDHNARHDRLEDAILSMEATQRLLAEGQQELRETQQRQDETQQQLKASALKHDMMLEMLQAMQRDHAADIQENKEAINRLVDIQDRMFTVVERLAEIQQAHTTDLQRHEEAQRRHEESQQRHEESQQAMQVAMQTLSTILRRLMENGNNGQ